MRRKVAKGGIDAGGTDDGGGTRRDGHECASATAKRRRDVAWGYLGDRPLDLADGYAKVKYQLDKVHAQEFEDSNAWRMHKKAWLGGKAVCSKCVLIASLDMLMRDLSNVD